MTALSAIDSDFSPRYDLIRLLTWATARDEARTNKWAICPPPGREYADSGKNRNSSIGQEMTSSPRRSMSSGLLRPSEPKQTTGSQRLMESAAIPIHKSTDSDTPLSKPDQEIESRYITS